MDRHHDLRGNGIPVDDDPTGNRHGYPARRKVAPMTNTADIHHCHPIRHRDHRPGISRLTPLPMPLDATPSSHPAWNVDGELLDPPLEGQGRAEISALADVVLAHYAGHRFERTTAVDAHHGFARYGWDLERARRHRRGQRHRRRAVRRGRQVAAHRRVLRSARAARAAERVCVPDSPLPSEFGTQLVEADRPEPQRLRMPRLHVECVTVAARERASSRAATHSRWPIL